MIFIIHKHTDIFAYVYKKLLVYASWRLTCAQNAVKINPMSKFRCSCACLLGCCLLHDVVCIVCFCCCCCCWFCFCIRNVVSLLALDAPTPQLIVDVCVGSIVVVAIVGSVAAFLAAESLLTWSAVICRRTTVTFIYFWMEVILIFLFASLLLSFCSLLWCFGFCYN